MQFIGHRLTKEGLKPDPAKAKAILSMNKPYDVPAVQRLTKPIKMYHGFGQKNRMLPLTRLRKQLPLPQSSSTLILASLQKEVEMLPHKDLVLYSHRKTTLSLMQAGL